MGRIRIAIGLGIVCVLLAAAGVAAAGGGPELHLVVSSDAERTAAIEVWVTHAPEIYGADVRLSFDPDALEVVDTDATTPGVHLTPGDFIDPAKGITIQNDVDNVSGSIDYALSLLNPAPPVQGDGVLARITFAAKREGQTSVTIEEGAFSSREGEPQNPKLDSVDLEITREENGDLIIWAIDTAASESRPPVFLWRVLGVIFLGLAGALLTAYLRYLQRAGKDS